MSLKRDCVECGNTSVLVKPLSLVSSLSCEKCAARYEYTKSFKEIHKGYSSLVGIGTVLAGILTKSTILTTLIFLLLLVGVLFLDLFFSYKTKLKLIGLKGIRNRIRERNS